MGFYFLFILTAALLLYRIFRTERIGKRTVLLALGLFLILTFAMHPWLKTSFSLSLLEHAAVWITLIWLASEPVLGWLERRRKEKGVPLYEIIQAARMLAESKQGALIAIQRKDSLEEWAVSGIPLDAQLRREIIFSIFTPPGALHDGGMLIRGDRIRSAGVVFPLSKRLDLPTELGTRHRAGLGLSEVTDAVVMIVSEETGKISIALGAKLLYDVKSEKLPEVLEVSLKNKSSKRRQKTFRLKSPFPSPEPVLR